MHAPRRQARAEVVQSTHQILDLALDPSVLPLRPVDHATSAPPRRGGHRELLHVGSSWRQVCSSRLGAICLKCVRASSNQNWNSYISDCEEVPDSDAPNRDARAHLVLVHQRLPDLKAPQQGFAGVVLVNPCQRLRPSDAEQEPRALHSRPRNPAGLHVCLVPFSVRVLSHPTLEISEDMLICVRLAESRQRDGLLLTLQEGCSCVLDRRRLTVCGVLLNTSAVCEVFD